MATNKYGVGSTGAATLSGFHQEEEELRDNIAKWLGFEKALTFSSGYQLNVGIYKQLIAMVKTKACNLPITIWLDKNCHASHIDGIMLAKAKFVTFSEESIENVFTKIKTENNELHIILTEGVFSMDGTCTYLERIITFKKENLHGNIMLIIDDAHGLGVTGFLGRGTCSHLDLAQIDLLIGTLGKAFATHGGFVCGKSDLLNYLEQTVRSGMYSTCLPPAIFAASNQSLAIIRSSIGEELRQILSNNIRDFQVLASQYKLPLHNLSHNLSPIQLLVFDNPDIVYRLHEELLAKDIMVGRIVYPTVSINTPRIRISLTAKHTFWHLQLLCESLSNILMRVN